MTNEEIMSRIVSVFDPVDRTREDHTTAIVVTVRNQRQMTDSRTVRHGTPPVVTWNVDLIHPHGKGSGFAPTLSEALCNLLRNLKGEPLTMTQHDALQALRVEVGL